MSEAATELADRDAVLAEADREWQRFQESLTGLTDDDYERPGVDGVWSLKNTISHFSGWYVEANRQLAAYSRGEPFPPLPGNFDAFNAASVDLRAKADPFDALSELRGLYGAWVGLVRRIPDKRFTRQLTRHWTIRAMIYHFHEHAPAVRAAHALARSEN